MAERDRRSRRRRHVLAHETYRTRAEERDAAVARVRASRSNVAGLERAALARSFRIARRRSHRRYDSAFSWVMLGVVASCVANDDLVLGVGQAIDEFLGGRRATASRILRSLPAPQPLLSRTRGAPRTLRREPERLTRHKRPDLPKSLLASIYLRDHFVCRYCGRQTIFLQVLNVLSRLFPIEFPTHVGWKIGVIHPAYWSHSTTLEHIVPMARGGSARDPAISRPPAMRARN